jgi:hypothetical protein
MRFAEVHDYASHLLKLHGEQSSADRRSEGGRMREVRRSGRGARLAAHLRDAQGDARTARQLILASFQGWSHPLGRRG